MDKCWRLIGLASAVLLMGQTTAPTSQPAGSEVERLRAENAALRAEVAALKAQGAGAQTQPAKKEIVRNFTSMTDILEKTPAELRPQAKAEWHKYTEGKFIEWVTPQVVGMTFEAEIKTNPSKASRNIFQHAPGAEWIGDATFESHHFTYFGADHSYGIVFPKQYFDEEAARKWDKIKAGTLFKIKGVIEKMSVSGVTSLYNNKLPSYRFVITLRDVELTYPK